jgi:glutamate/tyrosine decarboxylase-like PLP-dependent enzyme
MHKNGLNPFAFPSLRRFENEIVQMATRLLNGNEETRYFVTSNYF